MGQELAPRAPFDIKKLEGDYDGTAASWRAYFVDRVARMRSGEPTWMVRNFEVREEGNTDMGNGIIYDYYIGNQCVAIVNCSQGVVEHFWCDGEREKALGRPAQTDLASIVEYIERVCGTVS